MNLQSNSWSVFQSRYVSASDDMLAIIVQQPNAQFLTRELTKLYLLTINDMFARHPSIDKNQITYMADLFVWSNFFPGHTCRILPPSPINDPNATTTRTPRPLSQSNYVGSWIKMLQISTRRPKAQFSIDSMCDTWASTRNRISALYPYVEQNQIHYITDLEVWYRFFPDTPCRIQAPVPWAAQASPGLGVQIPNVQVANHQKMTTPSQDPPHSTKFTFNSTGRFGAGSNVASSQPFGSVFNASTSGVANPLRNAGSSRVFGSALSLANGNPPTQAIMSSQAPLFAPGQSFGLNSSLPTGQSFGQPSSFSQGQSLASHSSASSAGSSQHSAANPSVAFNFKVPSSSDTSRQQFGDRTSVQADVT